MRTSVTITTISRILLLVLFGLASDLRADEAQAREILVEAILSDGKEQIALVESLSGTAAPMVPDYLEYWKRGDIYLYQAEPESDPIPVLQNEPEVEGGEPTYSRIIDGELLTDGEGNALLIDSENLEMARPERKTRRIFTMTVDLLALSTPDVNDRADAALKLGLKQNDDILPKLQELSRQETEPQVIEALEEGIAVSLLAHGTKEEQLAAVETLKERNSIAGLDALKNLRHDLDDGYATHPFTEGEKAELDQAITSIESYIAWTDFVGTCFRGLSLGAVLLIVALGLAITFGLMGVINMAHGEMIAIGAYSAYISQQIFYGIFSQSTFALETYFLFAIPFSFVIAALCGLVLERTVIQFLYKRPLESLLATWGVSLILQQGFRLVFGAANRQVRSPSWLLGNVEIFDITFGFNRIFVIGFAILIVLGTWLLMSRTPFGLSIRAVMQDPQMAAAMGIRINRVRMMTFAFGSGLAGLAGVFLSQIGSVGSNLGQSYIVDSFMVVVAGGVGNIVGTIISALGIGVTDQALQPLLGPVMGRICVLVAIILFLQWKPGGLFPSKSRNLD
ncbi:MAG: urea ABC transporter permease subunit UrtB [Puniceicoccales bacterium]